MTTPPPIDAPDPSEDESAQGDSETQYFQKPPVSPRPKVSSEKFVDSVVALDLATRQQIEKAVSELPAEKRDSTNEIARCLVKSRVLSKMQSENIANGKGELLKVGEDYVILESIGKGGMGEVFKAIHRTMAREVAIKFVAMQVANDPETLARFQREVRAAAKLIHPNIVTAFDAGVDRKRPYLVMECVSGRDLAKVLAKHPAISIRQAIQWIEEAASGLACAHENGIVHRDIKPQNLFIDAKGHVKILDLGLALVAQDIQQSIDLTSSGTVMGTVDYMAPEQASDSKNVDFRADIYALGCTLYKILTGRAPFQSESIVNTLVAHRTKPIPSLKAARPDTPESLERLYQKMMAKRPEDRIRSMTDVLAALKKIRNESPAENKGLISNSVDSQAPSDASGDFLDVDFASITASEFNPHAIITSPGVTVVGYPSPSTLQAAAPKSNRVSLLVFGAIASLFTFCLICILGYAVILLGNRKPETIVIKEQAPAPFEKETIAMPPLPDPFSDRAAAEWVLALGGKVRVLEPNKESYDVWHPVGLPSIDFRIEGITLDGVSAVTDTSIAQVRQLTALRDLSIANTSISDSGLVYLKSLSTLRTLNVQGCKLTDAALETLSERTELATLLAGGNLTDNGMKSLHRLGKLTSVSFIADGPTGVGLDSLVKFSPNLGTLLTENFKVNDNDIALLKSLGNLRILGLMNAPLTDGCVEWLSELKNLRQLVLQGTQVSTDGLRRLQAALPNCKIYGGTYNPRRNTIRKILIAGGRVTCSNIGAEPKFLKSFNDLPEDFIVQRIDFEGVRPLQLDGMAIEELGELILTDSGIGMTDLRRVASHYPLLTELKIDGTVIQDNELTVFAGLKSLQMLDATRTSVKESGANQLKKELPNCDVLIGKSQEEVDRDVLNWILEIGGSAVVWTPENASLPINRSSEIPNGKLKLVKLVAGSNKQINDENITKIERARNLHSIHFEGNLLTDKGLKAFSRLRKLNWLNLQQGGKITEEGLMYLRDLPLVGLLISDAQITARGLRSFGKKESLKALAIGGNRSKLMYCNDETAKVVRELFPAMEQLWLYSTEISDEGARAIASLPNLKHITIMGNKISDAGIAGLCQNKKIDSMEVWPLGGAHSGDTTRHFTQLTELKHLRLRDWKIDDGAIQHLAKIRSLNSLELIGTGVTLRGVRQLEKMKPGMQITYDSRLKFCADALSHGATLKIEVPTSKSLVTIKEEDDLPLRFFVREVDFTGATTPSFSHFLQTREEICRYCFANCSNVHGSDFYDLAVFTSLQELDLSGTAFVDADLERLLNAPWLMRVNLKGTSITEKGVTELAKQLPTLRIEWDGGVIEGKKRASSADGKKKDTGKSSIPSAK